MMHGVRTVGGGMLAAALVLAGCSSDDTASQPETTGTDTVTETTQTTETATEATDTTTDTAPSPAAPGAGAGLPVSAVQQALRTAAEAVPNGRPFDLEIERDDGQRMFDIRVASDGNEFKVVVQQDGQQIVSQNQERRPSDDIAKVEGAQVDAAQAVQTAVDREPDSTVSDIEIDTHRDNVVVWKIELERPDGSDLEIAVDANTGAIIGS